MTVIAYSTAVILFCLGLYCTVTKRDLFKIVIGLGLIEGGIFLILITAGFVTDGVPPILPATGVSVNPLPHALILTAIVIGASDTALALAFIFKLHRHYGTMNVGEMRCLKG